ncbi:hypothetical protein TcCL_Unassigned02982 [Trypanosoma cruzi]|nr:hypothetical protein TcCL_Unassigned02982 [Trypanosoma cruzi]
MVKIRSQQCDLDPPVKAARCKSPRRRRRAPPAAKAERLHRREGVCGDRNSCGRLGCCCQAGNWELSEAMLSGRTLRSAGACKAASSCAVRPHRERGCPGSQVAAQRIQTHAQRETTSRPPPRQLPANNRTLSMNRTRMPAPPWAWTATPIHSATAI